MKFFVKYGRDKSDPEKSVLPCLIFIDSNHSQFDDLRTPGFMLCIGWWDYSLKIGLIFKKQYE